MAKQKNSRHNDGLQKTIFKGWIITSLFTNLGTVKEDKNKLNDHKC